MSLTETARRTPGPGPARRHDGRGAGAALALVFFYAPLEAEQGFLQKIFYVHVPLAIVTLCGFVVGGLHGDPAPAHARSALGHALLRRDPHEPDLRRRDVLITGSIWAKGSWGHWWVWNEPTLVSFLIVFLLYATYQPLRFAIEDPERQARYASVFAITAGAFVPMNFIAVRLSTAYLHPRVLGDTSNLPPQMALTFLRIAGGHRAAVRDAVQLRDDRQARPRAAAGAAPARCSGGRRQPRAARRPRSAAPSDRHAVTLDGGPHDVAGPSAGPAAARGRQVRRGRLHRAVRPGAHLRRDHGHPPGPHRARARRAAGALTPPTAAAEPSEPPSSGSTLDAGGGTGSDERAAGARHLAQDGAGRAARAAGASPRPGAIALAQQLTASGRGTRGGRDLDLQPHRGVPRGGRPGARRGRRARAAGARAPASARPSSPRRSTRRATATRRASCSG